MSATITMPETSIHITISVFKHENQLTPTLYYMINLLRKYVS